MENEKAVEALSRMLAQEPAYAIRYATHAAIIEGPYSEIVAARLKEIATDEILHAEKLRDRRRRANGGRHEVRLFRLSPMRQLSTRCEAALASAWRRVLSRRRTHGVPRTRPRLRST